MKLSMDAAEAILKESAFEIERDYAFGYSVTYNAPTSFNGRLERFCVKCVYSPTMVSRSTNSI